MMSWFAPFCTCCPWTSALQWCLHDICMPLGSAVNLIPVVACSWSFLLWSLQAPHAVTSWSFPYADKRRGSRSACCKTFSGDLNAWRHTFERDWQSVKLETSKLMGDHASGQHHRSTGSRPTMADAQAPDCRERWMRHERARGGQVTAACRDQHWQQRLKRRHC